MMNSNTFLARAIGGATLVVACLSAHAAPRSITFAFDGNASLNTDILTVAFSVDRDASDFKLWTDSWQQGLNFDPTLALWQKVGSDDTLLAEVDDDDTVGAGQGAFDAGIRWASLASGEYLVTLTASPNHAQGTLLSDGFAFDGGPAIPIAQWDQPGYDLNTNDQKGAFWSLKGEYSVSAVPEPSKWLLAAMTIMLWGGIAERKRRDNKR
jgi:hypothetical protein